MIAIKLTSKGPVIFKQSRIGKNGQPFIIYKFRTMGINAPHELATSQANNADRYINKVGKFLRKTSLDELPQLFNVVIGDMSLIGPRPLIPNEKEINKKRMDLGIYQFLPGITGLAQVEGRDMIDDEKKLKYDLYYCKNLTFKLDCMIVIKTFKQVIQHKNIKF